MDFTAAILKLTIMINYPKNQALVTKFWLKGCIRTKWYRSWRLSCRSEPVVKNHMQKNDFFYNFEKLHFATYLQYSK